MSEVEDEEEPQFGFNFARVMPQNDRTREYLEKEAAKEAKRREQEEDVSHLILS
jgi:hypothetical protein